MNLALVIGNVVSTDKYEAYEARKLMLVQKLTLDGRAIGNPTIAVDYVDAGVGDVVLLGAAPGLASVVFNYPKAPIRELIMGVIDNVAPLYLPSQIKNVVPFAVIFIVLVIRPKGLMGVERFTKV